MSRTLNLFSNTNLQGYGPCESSCLPCLGVSGRAMSVSLGPPRSECKTLPVKMTWPKVPSRHVSVCKASSGQQRRNPDFSRQNKFPRSRDSSGSLDEDDFLPGKNGPVYHSSSVKSEPPAAPGEREREIVEIFKKVKAQLLERAAAKEDKSNAFKGKKRDSETVGSDLVNLLRKHSGGQGKKHVNGVTNGSNLNISLPSGQRYEDRSRSNSSSKSTAKDKHQRTNQAAFDNQALNFLKTERKVQDEPQEVSKPSYSRPVSNFKKKSPVPKVRYEPIVSSKNSFFSVSHLDVDGKTMETPVKDAEPESDLELDNDVDTASGAGLDDDEEQEEDLESESEAEEDLELESEQEEDIEVESEQEDDIEVESEQEEDIEIESEEEEDIEVEDIVEGDVDGGLEEDDFSEAEEEDSDKIEMAMQPAESVDVDATILPESDENETEMQVSEPVNVSRMKLPELRTLAKARGIKEFLKLKKAELVELLSDKGYVGSGLEEDDFSEAEEDKFDEVNMPMQLAKPADEDATILPESDENESELQVLEPVILSCMKLPELKALAKARGMKRISYFKKAELVKLLSSESV